MQVTYELKNVQSADADQAGTVKTDDDRRLFALTVR
jgi:hypothetical protein